MCAKKFKIIEIKLKEINRICTYTTYIYIHTIHTRDKHN